MDSPFAKLRSTHLPQPLHVIQLVLSVAVKDLEAHIADCQTLGDAMSVWQDCRKLEAAFTEVSNLAGQKADSLQETR